MAAKIGLACLVIGLLCLVLIQSPQMSSAQSLSLPVCELYGAGSSSPYSGEQMQTEGVVHLDLDETSRKGFFLQQDDCDPDPLTSDGIFVYLGVQGDWVASGDRVRVDGRVQEYYGLTEIVSSPSDISVLSHHNPLPEAIEFDPPAERAAGSAYLETLEGMHLGLDEACVVGPMDTNDRLGWSARMRILSACFWMMRPAWGCAWMMVGRPRSARKRASGKRFRV